jgi:hypothetical protein
MSKIKQLEDGDVLGNKKEYYAKMRLDVYAKLTRMLVAIREVREVYDYVTGIGAIAPQHGNIRSMIVSVAFWLMKETETLEKEILEL